jgi:class 3 adenylate cyclase/HAMP domain-containing protein
MPKGVSVRGRLLFAFLGISAFAVLAAAASMWAFLELGRVVQRTTEVDTPAALASLELSRQTERIAAGAPALLAAPNEASRTRVVSDIGAQLANLEAILAKLRDRSVSSDFSQIKTSVASLGNNLDELDKVVAEKLATAQKKAKLLNRLSTTVIGINRLVAPVVLVLDSELAAWRRAGSAESEEVLARAAAGFVPLQKAQLEIAAFNDGLLKIAEAPSTGDLSILSIPPKRSLSALEAIASEFEPSLRGRFLERVRELRGLAEGSEGLPAARQRELEAVARGERILAENSVLSRGLTGAVDRLVAGAQSNIAGAGVESRRVRQVSTIALATIVLASILSSTLIVWLYVDRRLIARLKALAGSMLRIAGGELHAPLPAPGGDEIGRMAEALRVFRDTAVEVEEQRLRERQVVLDTIDYGVLILDQGLRVRMYNHAYVRLSGVDIEILRTNSHFREVMNAARRVGTYNDILSSDWQAYAEAQLAEIKGGLIQPREWRLPNGQTLEYQCVPLPHGGRMITYFDLTRLKKAEAELLARSKELADLNQQLEHRVSDQVHEIERMGRLRRFLPPQVADLIVASGNEKQLDSHRREITALFCDLRGFTGFTEGADAEDVIALLREYHAAVGEKIIKYSGTLERYAGDGVMVVFNDPVPVENPALQAVLMALEMRDAIGALTSKWRRFGHDIGFGIGIAHGYATLGTIGFEGRFDYAAIGTVSNVASRLCDEAKSGQILISSRVLVAVEDTVKVEPAGEFDLKGIRRPLAAYNVVAAQAQHSAEGNSDVA